MLREVERAPHFDRPVHHLATGLRRIAAAAREWLPLGLSRNRRMQSGLEVLDVMAPPPIRAGH